MSSLHTQIIKHKSEYTEYARKIPEITCRNMVHYKTVEPGNCIRNPSQI